MSATDNQDVLRRAIDHWNAGDLDGYLALYAGDVFLHSVPPDFPPGVEGVKRMYSGMWASHPGSTIEIEDLFGEGDKVACRYKVRAAHQATREEVAFRGLTILHFSGGRCVERWDFDRQEK